MLPDSLNIKRLLLRRIDNIEAATKNINELIQWNAHANHGVNLCGVE
jgi:hypothetical protein